MLPEARKANQTHNNPQQPIIIVVPSPHQQPIYQHQPHQQPNQEQFYQQPFMMPQNKPSVSHSSTNPMHHLMRMTPPQDQIKK